MPRHKLPPFKILLLFLALFFFIFADSCPKKDQNDDPENPPINQNDPCGNAVGNGNTIISGPSGPSGADKDSVFRSLTVDPTNPDIIYIGTERNGLLKSTDGGTNWTRMRQGLRSFNNSYAEFYDLCIAASQTNILYAATVDSPGPVTDNYPSSHAGVYKSTNGGQTWVRKNCGIDNSSITVVQIDPENPLIAVIGIRGGSTSFTELNGQYFNGGIYRTIDGGESWVKVNVHTGDIYSNFLLMRRSLIEPAALITFGFNYEESSKNLGFLKSTDIGISWTQFAPGLRELLISYFDISSDANVIYAVSRDEMKILKSTDGGTSWIEYQFQQSLYALAVSPSDSERVLFSVMDKLYLSIDGLLSFVMVINNNGTTFDDIVFAPSNNNVVYAVCKGYILYKSQDGGVTFTLIKNLRQDVLNVIN